MCIALVSYETIKGLPLLILHNRDEFFDRPAKPAEWQGSKLHGTDLESGGTWLAVDKSGSFALLTNQWTPKESAKKSRGEIVPLILDLKAFDKIEAFLTQKSSEYTPFNLIYGSKSEIFSFSSSSQTITPLSPGIHILTSGTVNEARFKSTLLRNTFAATLQDPVPEVDTYLQLLENQTIPEHTDKSLLAHFPENIARDIEAIFVDLPTYGTRASTILSISDEETITFSEKTHVRGERPLLKQFSYQTLRDDANVL